MKTKIDLEKFVRSLMERYYEKIHIDPTTTKCWLDSVLEDQGLEYKDGEIVKIKQEQPYNKPLFFEKGKWYTCIAKVDGFKVGHTYQSKMDGTVSNDSGAMYGYHNDVNLIFRPATDDEIPKEQEEREDIRKRYERIGNSDWFKKTHVGISIGEQPLEEDVVGMGGLGKVWNEEAIISRLDRIIELLERPIIMPFSQPIQPLQPIYYDPNKDKVYCSTASTEGGEE